MDKPIDANENPIAKNMNFIFQPIVNLSINDRNKNDRKRLMRPQITLNNGDGNWVNNRYSAGL
jgi:hypothetical protein